MSNPAVTNLCKTTVSGQPMWMDDNIGESIHLHINDVRVDLTDKEFSLLCSDICDAINVLIDVDGFDCHNINPVFFEDMLYKNILHLESISFDNVELKRMLCPFFGTLVPLPESRAVKALFGDKKENDDNRRSHHIGQTSEDRLNEIYESIEKNGYPFQNEYIIMYGDDNIIQDGQHRAACLWKLKGDVSVPVMRFHFDNYTNYNEKKQFQKTKLYYYYATFKENVPTTKVFFIKAFLKVRKILGSSKRHYIINKYRKSHGVAHDLFEDSLLSNY